MLRETSQTGNTNTVWSHLYVESQKKNQKQNTLISWKQNRMEVARGWGKGEMGRYRSKGINFKLEDELQHGDYD